jgi:hypothetical protein
VAVYTLGTASNTLTTVDIADSMLDSNTHGVIATSSNSTAQVNSSVRDRRTSATATMA